MTYNNCSPACGSSTSGEHWVWCRVGIVIGRLVSACAACLLLLSLGLYGVGVQCLYLLVMGVGVPAVRCGALFGAGHTGRSRYASASRATCGTIWMWRASALGVASLYKH